MTLSTYLLYLAAVALLVLSPGPTMLMCVTNAINHGPRAALLSATGSVTAALAVMLLSVLGLGALLAASEAAFTLLKTSGALYLVWLGIKTFRSKSLPMAERVDDPSAAPGARQSFYLQGLMVGGSNPKAILFFAALFPQFLNAAAPLWPQLLVLAPVHRGCCTFCRHTALGAGGARHQPGLRRPVCAAGWAVAAGASPGRCTVNSRPCTSRRSSANAGSPCSRRWPYDVPTRRRS